MVTFPLPHTWSMLPADRIDQMGPLMIINSHSSHCLSCQIVTGIIHVLQHRTIFTLLSMQNEQFGKGAKHQSIAFVLHKKRAVLCVVLMGKIVVSI